MNSCKLMQPVKSLSFSLKLLDKVIEIKLLALEKALSPSTRTGYSTFSYSTVSGMTQLVPCPMYFIIMA